MGSGRNQVRGGQKWRVIRRDRWGVGCHRGRLARGPQASRAARALSGEPAPGRSAAMQFDPASDEQPERERPFTRSVPLMSRNFKGPRVLEARAGFASVSVSEATTEERVVRPCPRALIVRGFHLCPGPPSTSPGEGNARRLPPRLWPGLLGCKAQLITAAPGLRPPPRSFAAFQMWPVSPWRCRCRKGGHSLSWCCLV